MPELWPEVAWYLDAFKELSWSRPVGFGSIGYVPVVEIVAWADANGVQDVPTLIRHVRALDIVYVAEQVERQKRDAHRAKDQREADRGTGGA